MKPIDFRNATFEGLREGMTAKRQAAYEAWLAHGPGTTRDVARLAGWDILQFRPRTTELFQMGMVTVINDAGHEGVYRARTQAEWTRWAAQFRPGVASQLQLAVV